MKFVLLAILLTLATSLHAADPALAPPDVRRPADAILRDWRQVSEEIRSVLPRPDAMMVSDDRAALAKLAMPLLVRAIRYNTEMYHATPDAQAESRRNHYQLLAIMASLGDAGALQELDESREANHRDIARNARQAWYLARWWSAADRAAASAILDELDQLAADAPADDELAGVLLRFHQDGRLAPELDQRIRDILERKLRGPLAQEISGRFRAADKRKSLLGKPLVIAAPTLAGRPFTTASLHGKTVLLHVGETTSEAWGREHALLRRADWPDSVARVTLLADEREEDVQQWLGRAAEVPWPILRDPTAPASYPAQFGIEDLPSTLLIAADGTVSAVDVILTPAFLDRLCSPSPSTTKD